MVQRITPFVRALIKQPEREDIPPRVTDNGLSLFHFIKGSAGFLYLDHFVGSAETMKFLLDRVRSRRAVVQPAVYLAAGRIPQVYGAGDAARACREK
jgi:chemotaxis protein histidine kinase CheA